MEWKKITKEEFIKQYTIKSGYTIEELENMGIVPIPCSCDYSGCRGWCMGIKEDNKK